MSTKVKSWNGTIFGNIKLSDYAKEHGRVDYAALAKMLGGAILNNEIIKHESEYWIIENGSFYDEDNNESEVFQYFIISPYGARMLQEYTDELVFYNEELNIYLWGITHFGTSWDYVLTDIEVEEVGNDE